MDHPRRFVGSFVAATALLCGPAMFFVPELTPLVALVLAVPWALALTSAHRYPPAHALLLVYRGSFSASFVVTCIALGLWWSERLEGAMLPKDQVAWRAFIGVLTSGFAVGCALRATVSRALDVSAGAQG